MTAGWLVLAAAVVLVAAATQRITGMGFALVASPVFVLLLDPDQGVGLVLVVNLVVNVLVAAQTWRHIEVKRLVVLLISSVPGWVLGWWATRSLPLPVLGVFVAGIMVVALALVRWGASLLRLSDRMLPLTGTAAGFMNTTAGVGGPPLAVHALSARWDPDRFAATVQPYFLVSNLAAIGAHALPPLAWWGWLLLGGAALAGAFAGSLARGRITVSAVRSLVWWVAMLGAFTTLARSLQLLLAR